MTPLTNRLDRVFAEQNANGYWRDNERIHQGYLITITKSSPMVEAAHSKTFSGNG